MLLMHLIIVLSPITKFGTAVHCILKSERKIFVYFFKKIIYLRSLKVEWKASYQLIESLVVFVTDLRIMPYYFKLREMFLAYFLWFPFTCSGFDRENNHNALIFVYPKDMLKTWHIILLCDCLHQNFDFQLEHVVPTSF